MNGPRIGRLRRRGRCNRRARRLRGERGQTAVLVVGLAVVVAMTVVVVVDATAAYLRRQALNTLADGAALAAVDGIEGEQVYVSGLGDRPTVDARAAQELVAEYLQAVGAAGRYPGLDHVVETRGDRVVVVLSSPLELPFGVPGVGDSAHVTATGAAVITLSEQPEAAN